MQDRFVVVNSRPLENEKKRESWEPPHWKVRGYRILDTHKNCRLRALFSTREEAQAVCDAKNKAAC
jgi:hypothetical protein